MKTVIRRLAWMVVDLVVLVLIGAAMCGVASALLVVYVASLLFLIVVFS